MKFKIALVTLMALMALLPILAQANGYMRCYNYGAVIFEGVVRTDKGIKGGLEFLTNNGNILIVNAPCVFIDGTHNLQDFKAQGGK